jgi:4-amino-4-deoxychorismate lyase
MRGLILDHAADAGLDCRVERCSPSLLRDADELFLTNAVIGIWPVVACEDRAYPIGPVIRGLMRALAAEFPPLAMEDPHE